MKQKYHINPVTLSLEHVEQGLGYWLRRSGFYLLGGICLGIVFFFLFYHFFPSPRERQLINQRNQLEVQLELLDDQVNQMQVVMADLSQRDDNLYRVLLGADSIPVGVRQGATKKMSYYDDIRDMTNSELAANLTLKTDILEKELYVQAKSYDEIIDLAKTQEIKMENIPAIQPVLNKNLTRVASGYGWRVDPVYHVRRFHEGMDFTAPKGTDVFATGNGKVVFVGHKQGYGNTVIVDHGFGYQTLYAHLFKSLCRVGQKVKRADIIALVGNTGKSTGPHLHYEVHYHGKAIDPRNFYFYDLTPEEYDKMVQLSNNFGRMLD
ncbi:MAG: M23 family metallopeptidase [Paludibacteraceae bacterium]|nr:M23 family metallopeptidase [Paludibacteraceae bacterium]